MSFKPMHLVLCFVLTLTATCQDTEGIKNGKAICQNNGSTFTNSSCNNLKDNIAKWIGVDCCNTVAEYSMNTFQDIVSSKISSHLSSLIKDPQAVS